MTAPSTERQQQIQGRWYNPDEPGQLHDDLRADYALARAVAYKRPSVRRHMESCAVCVSIGDGVAKAPAPASGRKRLKLAIRPEQMHQLLRLPANFEIVHLYAENDPNVVYVLIAGEGLPDVAEDAAAPTARPEDVIPPESGAL